jgi:hypothetical protein
MHALRPDVQLKWQRHLVDARAFEIDHTHVLQTMVGIDAV